MTKDKELIMVIVIKELMVVFIIKKLITDDIITIIIIAMVDIHGTFFSPMLIHLFVIVH